MTEFHPSTGYHWKAPAESTPTTAPGASTPSIPGLAAITAPGAAAPAKAGNSYTFISANIESFIVTCRVKDVFARTASIFLTCFGCCLHARFIESKEYQVAVDRAIKNVEQQMHMKQMMLQAGNAAASGGAAGGAGAGTGADAKVKQEGAAGAGVGSAGGGATANSAAAAKGTPKSTAKRRKKSEEASAAAASMGINTSVAAASQSRGPPSAGVTPGGPATPTSAPVKRRKKTKNIDPK